MLISEEVLKKVVSQSIKKIIKEKTDRTLIIYHRVDWDGFTSAAVALMANPNAELFGWNYYDNVPNVDGYDKVILVDLTVAFNGDYSWMEKNANKLIWIDHHANAISNNKLSFIDGIREDGIGACALTWKYFFGGKMPLHVSLCATYDVFRKDGAYCDWEDAWAYQLALAKIFNVSRKASNYGDLGVQAALSFIKESPKNTIERIDYGHTLEEQRSQKETEIFKKAEFSEKNGIRICKLVSGDAALAQIIKNNIDNHTADVFFLISPEELPDGTYKVAIRVPEKSNVDASAIARQYNGNGHIKASGCKMTLEQFKNI